MNNKKGNAVIEYAQNSVLELRKVTWPTKQQAFKLTMLVLGFCLVSALVMGLVDAGLNLGYTQLLGLSQ